MNSADLAFTLVLCTFVMSVAAVRISYWIGYWKSEKKNKGE